MELKPRRWRQRNETMKETQEGLFSPIPPINGRFLFPSIEKVSFDKEIIRIPSIPSHFFPNTSSYTEDGVEEADITT
jgi:hypothetical protein